ncbi:MAG: hypothetical protein R2771_03435 [Saprospiraceae bacterium]
MKRYYVVIFLIFIIKNISYSQPTLNDGAKTEPAKLEVGGDCWKVVWSFPDNAIIFPDCPEFNISDSWTCKIIKTDCNSDCIIDYDIWINNSYIEKISNWYWGDGIYKIDFSDYINDEIKNGKTNISISIFLEKNCLFSEDDPAQEIIRNIQIVHKGEPYSIFTEGTPDNYNPNYNACEETKKIALYQDTYTCCGDHAYVSSNFEIKNVEHNPNLIGNSTVTIGFSYQNLNLSYQQEFQVPTSYVDEISSSSVIKYVNLDPTINCQWAGLDVIFKPVYENIFINDCDPETTDELIDSKTHYIPFAFAYKKCDEENHCTNPIKGKIEKIKEDNILVRSSCNGILKMIVDFQMKFINILGFYLMEQLL